MGKHNHPLMEVLEREYPNGVSFDPMTLRLLRKKISITDEQIEELRGCMFQLGDQRWFSSVMVSEKETQLKFLSEAVTWLEKYGCFSLGRLFEKYAGEMNHISTVEQFSVFLQHLDFGFDVKKTAKGGFYCLLPSLKECLTAIASQLKNQIDEAGGELSLQEIEGAFPYLTTDALEDIRSRYLSDEVYLAYSSEVILWRSSELLHLPDDFDEKLTNAVDTLVELEENITPKNLEFALNVLFRYRFREEYSLQDNATFKRVCAEHYQGEHCVMYGWKMSSTRIKASQLAGGRRQRRVKTTFSLLKIPAGAELVFTKYDSITCTVFDDINRVKYDGKLWSISTLAKHLLNGRNVSGFGFFCYQRETLWDRRLRLEQGGADV